MTSSLGGATGRNGVAEVRFAGKPPGWIGGAEKLNFPEREKAPKKADYGSAILGFDTQALPDGTESGSEDMLNGSRS